MPLKLFISKEKSGGIVLAISVIVALLLANSPWKEQYFYVFENHFALVIGDTRYLDYNLHHWINDGLMALFFFVVGLELKREFIGGELSDIKQTILPICGAVGGMLVPALFYLVINYRLPSASGWGIPMSTDIAFALGLLVMLGKRVPTSAKVFLTTLAIVDDLGAVLVIAFFYTSSISFFNLLLGFVILMLMFMANKLGVKSVLFYAVFGLGSVWIAFMLSGIHATIAAVLTAFVIPADTRLSEAVYLRRLKKLMRRFEKIKPNEVSTLREQQVAILSRIESETKTAIPPLQQIEHKLSGFVTFIILPIFALANAGVDFSGLDGSVLWHSPIMWGIILGLLLGKPIGIVLLYLVLKGLKIVIPPETLTIRSVLGLGFLASIGFTMSMFVATLAFSTQEALLQAKIGIFVASLLGGLLGYFLLRSAFQPKKSVKR